MSNYQNYVETSYKSLEKPDFSFVRKILSSRPYDPVLKRLRDYCVVEELTEADDDVCFSYLVKGRHTLWKLDLSLVGPFGIFVRLKASVSPEDFVHYEKADIIGFESKVLDVLKGSGIRLLTTEELTMPLPMTLYNTPRSEVCLYQALFSDRKKLPWL